MYNKYSYKIPIVLKDQFLHKILDLILWDSDTRNQC